MDDFGSTPHVCLHGWTELADGSQEYCDLNDPELSGYCVFFRFPADPQFDTSDERDFINLDDARAYAADLCIQRGCSHIEEY